MSDEVKTPSGERGEDQTQPETKVTQSMQPSDGQALNDQGAASPNNDSERQRKRRNIAIALGVAGFVLLVYLVTILRIGASITERSF